MTWEAIHDLPETWPTLVSTEVESLAQAWEEIYNTLKDTAMLQSFNERLRREWSIETGIIERLYTIDRGTTQLLIEQGIDSAFITHGATDRPVAEVIQIIQDQREALDGLFAFVAQKQPLTIHYIRSLHQVLVRHQEHTEARDQFGKIGLYPLIKGDWKRQPNNPQRPDGYIHEYCPPEQVQSEMDCLVALHNQHTEQLVSPQIEAAWLHHRFTQIHPFQDGNGRVARSLATIVLIQSGRFPLVITRDHRDEYIKALEEADSGDLSQLVRLFDQIEKRAYVQALDLSEDVLQTRTPVFSLIDSIAERYQERQRHLYDRVFNVVARQIYGIALADMETLATHMRQQFQSSRLQVSIRVDASAPEGSDWYRAQIVKVARDLDYFANLTRPRLWVRLSLIDDSRIAPNADIVVSLHYLGKENRGVMVATAFLDIVHTSTPEDPGDQTGERRFRETHTIVSDGFTFAHTDIDLSERRQQEFRQWLEQAMIVGLAEWQKQL
ncbi:MAG: Fic family protein [Roseiflexaceae bacterium]